MTEKSHFTNKRIFSNSFWLILEKFVRLLAGFFVGLQVARHLGPEKMGYIQYSMSVMGFAGVFVYLGLKGVVVKYFVTDEENTPRIMCSTFFAKTISGIIVFIVCFFITMFTLRITTEEGLVQLVILGTLLLKPFETVDYFYEARVRSKIVAIRKIVISLLLIAIRMIGIVLNMPVTYFALAVLLEFFFTAVIMMIIFQKKEKMLGQWRISFPLIRKLLSESWVLIFSGVLSTINLKIDQIMLRWMKGSESVGLYGTAVLVSESWYFVATAVVASSFPLLLKLRKEDDFRYKTRMQKTYSLLVFMAIIAGLATTFLIRPLLLRILGDEYFVTTQILLIHVWAGIFFFQRQLFSKWLIAESLYKFSLLSHMSGAIINVCANSLLIPGFGPYGAAVATLLSYTTSSFLILFFFKQTRPQAIMMVKSLLNPLYFLLGRKRTGKNNKNTRKAL